MPPPACPAARSSTPDRSCDALDFHYRLIHTATVNVDNQTRRVPVEVILHARLERCPGPLALGDLVYSTTLLPGEKVRLFSADRRTRFSLDSSTSVSYRHEQTSEERYFMSSMSDFMSDLTVRDEARSANQKRGSFETHAGTSGALEAFFAGPSVDVKGSYNAEFDQRVPARAEPARPRLLRAFGRGDPRGQLGVGRRGAVAQPQPKANPRITSNPPRGCSPTRTAATR